VGKLQQILHPKIALSSLDLADVAPRQVSAFRQPLLAEFPLLAKVSDTFAE
jgi:hypothetical protein